MSYSYDLTTDVGKMRLVMPDNKGVDAADAVFEDEELAAYLAMEGGVVKRGAALALESIATNEVLVLKVLQSLDRKTDGAKVLDAILKRAGLLRAQADDEEVDPDDDEGFEVIEQVFDDFTYREHQANDAARSWG